MALSEGFNEVEQLQALVRRYINSEIREHFRDLGDEFWEPEVNTTRGAMRYALTHKDNDTINTTLLRLFLYYFTYGQARELQPPVYGIPIQDFQETFRFHPQIKLFFQEDQDRVDEENGFYPVTSEVNFRLMEETAKTLTPAKAKTYANKIKNIFCANKGFVWKKGKEFWTYIDMHKGYKFQLYASSKQEAQNLISRVLDVQNHTPDWDIYLKDATKRKDLIASSPLPPKELIYGKPRRLARTKPVAYVRFKYAELHIHGLPRPVTLVDRGGTRRTSALVAA